MVYGGPENPKPSPLIKRLLESTTQPCPPSTGWVCPVCSKGVAPWAPTCPCKDKKP